MIHVPSVLLDEVEALVAQGAFASRDEAIAQLLRLGLDAFHGARSRGPRPPPLPPMPPLNRDPHDDDPISVDPTRPQYL